MRRIEEIIVHCSAADFTHGLKDIDYWHKKKRWAGCGYHYVINNYTPPFLEIGRRIDQKGAHTYGRNDFSIGICVCGEYQFQPEQFRILTKLLKNLVSIFNLEKDDIVPHRMYNHKKTCPNFELETVLNKYWGIV